MIAGTPRHMEQARDTDEDALGGQFASIILGGARQLEHDDSSAEGILLLRPLYHPTEHTDRIRTVQEAFRVLRPGSCWLRVSIALLP